MLVAPKDKDTIIQTSGIIYRLKYDRMGCNHEYMAESERTFGERLTEHLKNFCWLISHIKWFEEGQKGCRWGPQLKPKECGYLWSSPIPLLPDDNRLPDSRGEPKNSGEVGPEPYKNRQRINFIRVTHPTLNINIGNYNLPHVWDIVLLNNPELYFKD